MSFLYFGYASNMLKQRMHINCPSAKKKCIGELKKYCFGYDGFAKAWQGATATIFPKEDASVFGVIWEISKEHEEILRRQESGYEEIWVNVETKEYGVIECKVFQKLNCDTTKDSLPSLVYKSVIIQGAKENNVPSYYIEKLKLFPDNGYKGKVDIPVDIQL